MSMERNTPWMALPKLRAACAAMCLEMALALRFSSQSNARRTMADPGWACSAIRCNQPGAAATRARSRGGRGLESASARTARSATNSASDSSRASKTM